MPDTARAKDHETSEIAKRREESMKVERERREAKHIAAREAAARELAAREAAAKERQRQLLARHEREASVIEQYVVLDSSLVTCSAGLNIQNVVTGFELCRITIKNLPRNARRNEIAEIFEDQGVDKADFFILEVKEIGDRLEAVVLANADQGQAIAVGLEDIEFRDRILSFEVSDNASWNTMGSSSRNSDFLTVFWRIPTSETVIANYSTMDEARSKVVELGGKYFNGQRIKAEMNQPPRGPVRRFVESSVKLTGFPLGTSVGMLYEFLGCSDVRTMKSTSCTLEDSFIIIRQHLSRCSNIRMETYQVLTPNPTDGNVRVKVQFDSWEDAKQAFDSLEKKRLVSNSPFYRPSLPNPIEYSIMIPRQQYEAQKKQWDSMSEKRPGTDSHIQIKLGNRGDYFIRVLGQDKKDVGSLKVRVESMVAGEKLDSRYWHQSFSSPSGKTLFDRIHGSKNVFVRMDFKIRALKIYGDPATTEEVKEMIREEVDRLAGLETTLVLDGRSVGYFMREGLGKLKELLGDDSVVLNLASRPCKITIKGGEEAKHHLYRLIEESRMASHADQNLPGDAEKETCPICYDEVPHPEQLGCGHTYCTGCLRHYLTSALEGTSFPLVCMGDETACKVPISIPLIRRFLTPQVFQSLVEISFRSYLEQHSQELKYCTTPDCQQIYRHGTDKATLQCPSCFATICSSCDEEAHEGMTCQERKLQKDPTEQDRLFNEWIAANNGQRCPTCRRVIQKSAGCNHMQCPCGAHFCWRCLKAFGAGQIYDHMNSAHGGIYEDVPAWADPDNRGQNVIAEQADLLARVQREQEQVRAREQQRRLQEIQQQNRLFWAQQGVLQTAREEERARQLQAAREVQARQAREERARQLQTAEEEQARQRGRVRYERARREEEKGGWCVVM
ncbi:hypothetical protein B0H34DRAFT_796535 [Crassisporium funariophilum]|nr:hypothetical protein B0H34DRAFT_796535 [Crassisporium funariophilum]